MASTVKPALTKLFVARLPWITCRGKDKKGILILDLWAFPGVYVKTTYGQDMNTGRSKKFGFVVYKDKSSADNALSQSCHIVDGKKLAVLLSDVPTKDRDVNENSQ